jgi:hypothetical protein
VAGDATNILDELCGTLDACYGGDPAVPDCNTTLRDRYADGTQLEVDGFVRFVGARECFDTCPHALGCTDQPPLCVANGACAGRSDCCGWTQGTQDCVGGACCLGQGQPCDQSADECCQHDCRKGFCGGRECVPVDQPCASSFDCCTQRCVQGTCEALSECATQGQACQADVDCCADNSPDASTAPGLVCDPDSHTCAPPRENCQEGSPCELGGGGDDCCADSGLKCWPSLAGGVCGETGCSPLDVDCESDGDCCLPAVCNYSPSPHCEIVNPGNPMCSRSGELCGEDQDCCSSRCDGGTCVEFSHAPCGLEFACHDACSTGDAMAGTSCEGDPSYDGQVACISSIVQADPFCGCTEWDALCQDAALLQCGCP